jgi:phospholipid/cholesterol/gamma-HCH transport system ATP-binding protein
MEKQLSHINYQNPVNNISGLRKSFGDLHVLRGVDLQLFEGENLVVLGRSGTGKSVLIKIVSGLLSADEGTVNVLGQEVGDLDEKELMALRLRIGFSFQNSALYDSMTVRENLEFPLVRNKRSLTRAEIDREVREVLDSVGLLQA